MNGVYRSRSLAYMRGRTLNDAFIILDESQNTTAEQMKMFLTRIGFGSTVVVTGDMTQIDSPVKPSPGCGMPSGCWVPSRVSRLRTLARETWFATPSTADR